jgi:hypothetical protein
VLALQWTSGRYFFTFQGGGSTRVEGPQPGTCGAADQLLGLMLRSVMESAEIEPRCKIPLALQYVIKWCACTRKSSCVSRDPCRYQNSAPAIRRLLLQGGITKDGRCLNNTGVAQSYATALLDPRPLIWAAFHDNAEVVRHLLDYGVPIDELDRLVLCEIRTDAVANAEKEHFLSTAQLERPPRGWAPAGGSQQVAGAEQLQIAWQVLPRAAKETAHLRPPDGWDPQHDGTWMTLSRAQQIDAHLAQHGAVTWQKLFGPPIGSCPGHSSLADPVPQTLPLGERSRYCSDDLFHGRRSGSWCGLRGCGWFHGAAHSRNRAERAFAHWTTPPVDTKSFSDDGLGPWEEWRAEWGVLYQRVLGTAAFDVHHCTTAASGGPPMPVSPPPQPLSAVHRIWWAVVTRRYQLAELLVRRAPDSVCAAFVAAWAFRNLPDSHMNAEEREARANDYDLYSYTVIHDFQDKAERKHQVAFLQQYLYFSHDDAGSSAHDQTSFEKRPLAFVDHTACTHLARRAGGDSRDGAQHQIISPQNDLRRVWSGPMLRGPVATPQPPPPPGGRRHAATCARAPHPLYTCLTVPQRHANAALRDALGLMGFDGELPVTRLDLACAAQCKKVLELDCVEEFMDMLWTRPLVGRTRVVERLLGGVAPRLKCCVHIGAFGLFLSFFTLVFFGLQEGRAGVSWMATHGHTDGAAAGGRGVWVPSLR